MVLLKKGWEMNYFGNPEVHKIGCVGEIQYSEKLEDGRYNIMIYGISRVKILNFVQEEPYRIARVKNLKDSNFDHDEFNVKYEAENFIELVRHYLKEVGIKNMNNLLKLQSHSLESIMNQVASILDVEILEKQVLLEMNSLEVRYDRLTQIIKDKLKAIKIAKSVKFIPDDPRRN